MKLTTNRRARLIPWLAAITFLLSLAGPMLTLAAPPPEDPPPNATQCPDGMTWNEETEECEPPPDIPVDDPNEPLDCPDGQVDQQGTCVPDPNLPLDCPDGQVDQQGTCVPDPNQQPPGCEAGQTLDEQGNCVPDTEQFPTCDQGTVLNPQTNMCDPVEQSAPPPPTQPGDEGETSAPLTAVNFIAFVVHDCAGRVSDPNLTESEYERACLGSHSEVEFVAEYGGRSWTNSSNSRGQVGWYNVPAGPWIVQETIPPRYSDPVVFCGSESGGDLVPVDASGGRISGTFATTGEMIFCDWYSLRPPRPTHDQQLTIFKRTCPLGTDRTLDIESLMMACQITPDVEFFASQGSPQLEQRTNGRNGGVTWRSMFSGPWWVEETPLPTTGAPKVICGYRDESTGAPTWTEVPVTGTRLEGTFEPGADPYECYWFNFRTEPTIASNQIVILPFRCPEGTDTELSFAELLGTAPCPVETEAIFTLVHGTPEIWSGRSVNLAGEVMWTDVPPVRWEVRQTLVPGFGATRVYCSLNGHRPFDLVPSAGASIDGRFESTDERLLCYWYNFAGIAAEVVPPVVTADTAIPPPIVIEAVKHTCPAGTDTSLPLADLTAACPVTPGVDFVLEYGGSTSHQVTDASGTVRWTDVPQVEWSLYEGIPPGFGEPFASCGAIGEASPSVFQTVRGSWTGFPASAGVHCDWFNFPTDETQLNTIAMYPYACPEGADPSLDITVLLMECAPIPDVEFTATIGGSSESHRTGSEGWAFWHDVPTGPWSMRETVPDGYPDPLVVCSPLGYPYDHPTLTTTGSVIEENFLGTGAEMRCALFHFTGGSDTSTEPGDDSHTIEIDKYDCPVGVDASASREYLLEMCLPFPDIEFTVTADGTSTALTTDAVGHVTFPGIPDGPYTIQETMPGGYDDPAVYCGSGAVPAPGGLLEDTFDTPGDLHCQWFNLWPGGEESITLLKYVCPATVDPTADIATITAECTEPGDGYSFTLHSSRGSSLLITNSSGRLDWGRDNVRGGPFTLTELVPDDARGAPVWQCGANGERATVDAPDGELSASFREGHYACWVYNFPAADTEAVTHTVEIDKFDCPEGTSLALGWDDLRTTCAPAPGIEFTVTVGGTSTSLTTDAAGNVVFIGIPDGSVEIQETIPSGYGDPTVYCNSDGAEDAFDAWLAPGGLLEDDFFPEDEALHCLWFNSREGAYSARIVIQKGECPDATIDPSLGWDALNRACPRAAGYTFRATGASGYDESDVSSSTGTVIFSYVPAGPVEITETIPPGYGDPIVFCELHAHSDGSPVPMSTALVPAPGGVITREVRDNHDLSCGWFNVPLGEGEDDTTVTANKWACPAGTDAAALTYDELIATCATPLDGVAFDLSDGDGLATRTTIGGTATWTGVSPGVPSLTEHTPPGYLDPVVYCSLTAVDATGTASHGEEPTLMPVYDSTVSRELPDAEFTWICDFFNVEKGPGEITINKWTCPAGYDVDAPGADPTVDCTESTDGVTFTLEYSSGVIGTATTGDVIPGAVSFAGLDPDVYAITETLPEGIDNVFVWDCTGTDIGSVHPTPLSRGIRLSVEVAGGDAIVCDWYNVPDPVSGTVTVIKQECSTPTFVDADDCDTYEHGAEFELFEVDGDISHGAGTTDASGGFSWTGLPEGRYRLEELGQEPCHVTVSRDDGAGVPWVEAGEPTVFTVYNCADTTTTTSTGKIPTDYPNTGAGPVDDGVSPVLQDGTGAATPEVAASPEAFYEIACLDTPAGTPVPETECARGAVPTHLTIAPIGVDAEIEVVEIVDGVMQPPSDPHVAAWYKETARLGEANNTVIAGHLNWWNVPEGVFYRLDALEEGDRIAVTGDDGLVYVYEVQWVRLEPNDAPPALDVVGPTEAPSLTLITCGGEWDAAAAAYDHRTVVRAELVDIVPGDPAATTQSGRTS